MARGFQGNPLIRKSGDPVEYNEKNITELLRCSQDPAYFVEHYIRIKNVDYEDLVLFKMRWYQRLMLDTGIKHRKVITKLPRQAGKTSITAAVLLWHMLFIKNYSILVVAHKLDKARDIIGVIKEMIECLPGFLQQGVVEWNKGNVVLENRSRIRASATSASSARGDTYNLVYMDEFAFVPTHIADDFIRSVIPTVSAGKTTKVWITSTPKGLNMFYKMWVDAKHGRSDYVPIEIKWDDVPGRDAAWRSKVVAEFGEQYFEQEYGAEFLGSSRTLIAASKLRQLTWVEPMEVTEHFRVFEKAQKHHQYLITVDTSEGVGLDYSVAVVVDVSTSPYNVVCIYRNRYISEMAYPNVLYSLGKSYNNATILIEINRSPQIADILHYDMEYEGVMWIKRKRSTQQAGAGFDNTSRPGLFMDQKVKRYGCLNLKSLIENDQLVINDYLILSELERFILDGPGKGYCAEEGNDDLVMALVQFAWLVDQGYIRELTETSARARVAEAHKAAIDAEMMPLGFVTYGDDEVKLEGYLPAVRPNDNRWLFPELTAEKQHETLRPTVSEALWEITTTATTDQLRRFYGGNSFDD